MLRVYLRNKNLKIKNKILTKSILNQIFKEIEKILKKNNKHKFLVIFICLQMVKKKEKNIF